MGMVGTNMKMVTTLRVCTSRTKKGAMGLITLVRDASWSHSSTPFLLKYLKSPCQMDQSIWVSSGMEAVKVLGRRHTWMAVHMMGSGVRTRSTEWGSSSTSTRRSTTGSGRTTCAKATAPTTTPMGTGMKASGIATCKMAQALTTTPMEIFTREIG